MLCGVSQRKVRGKQRYALDMQNNIQVINVLICIRVRRDDIQLLLFNR